MLFAYLDALPVREAMVLVQDPESGYSCIPTQLDHSRRVWTQWMKRNINMLEIPKYVFVHFQCP